MSHTTVKSIVTGIMARLQARSTGVETGVIDIIDGSDPVAGKKESSPADAAISKRAYELWLQRGCPEGSPEEDWFQAESELKERADPAKNMGEIRVAKASAGRKSDGHLTGTPSEIVD